jgi:hypothetical protein
LVEPTRRFVREGILKKASTDSRGRVQDRMFFLFNDMLIWAKPSMLKKNSYLWKGKLTWENLILSDDTHESGSKKIIVF